MKAVTVTEYLRIDLEREMWYCVRCEKDLVSAREPYFKGCLVHDRPATEIYGQSIEIGDGEQVSYAPDPAFTRILEFYCPHCGTLVEVQYLPPGHPIPVDISIDLDVLRERYGEGQP